MISMHEANAIVRFYLKFQPLTSLCWKPLAFFLQGMLVNHSAETDYFTTCVEEYLDSMVNGVNGEPSGALVTLLRDSPLHRLADFEGRTVYARTKVLYHYLNTPTDRPEFLEYRVFIPRKIKPSESLPNAMSDWDVIDNGSSRYFWLDDEWIWYANSKE